ncbi:MAG TPA: DUF523 domain-containing protein [Candidatus Avalokitesvara rifleensis]|uniref:DUF523 domain-containing protein n=1 Tax=Candidatus Avalokitesvara rifleensis TaxID=3367620 RepID=UPI002713E47B|nr:DUF523 domain-containing protein [Candidatus Brocadiales bacterium]
MVLISGCLVGLECRYDGGTEKDEDLLASLRGINLLPFCPEQMGGLPTPRPRAEITGGDGHDVLARRARVVNEHGEDVTEPFIRGAMESMKLVRLFNTTKAYLKGKSPSCGLGTIFRNGRQVKGDGVCAALLSQSGVNITCV